MRGAPRRLPLKLSESVALDLWAFSELHYGAPHTRIIEEAVRRLIEQELERDPLLRERFKSIRSQRAEGSRPRVMEIRAPAAEE